MTFEARLLVGLPLVRLFICTPNARVYRRFLLKGALPTDAVDDVRELVCERIRFDVYAEWADPRDWLRR